MIFIGYMFLLLLRILQKHIFLITSKGPVLLIAYHGHRFDRFRVLFIGFCQLLQKRRCKVAILLFFLAKPGYIDYSHRCNDQLY